MLRLISKGFLLTVFLTGILLCQFPLDAQSLPSAQKPVATVPVAAVVSPAEESFRFLDTHLQSLNAWERPHPQAALAGYSEGDKCGGIPYVKCDSGYFCCPHGSEGWCCKSGRKCDYDNYGCKD
jgi:hypothetical protein